MTNKFISIIGQTATGKTDKAFELAEMWIKKNLNQEVIVISADSKQVFTDLEILSGADVPENFERVVDEKYSYPFFAHPSLPIYLHGTSCLDGDQEWSVGHFHNLIKKLTNLHPDALFIMVGGTGLYHKQIYRPAGTLHIKPNKKLREKLDKKNIGELQALLEKKNPERFDGMNNSDKNNPRRLIRAIEIEDSGVKHGSFEKKEPIMQIGLNTDDLDERIGIRVVTRLQQKAIDEVKNFEEKYPEKNLQAKASLGYQEILNHINQEISREEMIKLWKLSEVQYSKKQNTWWKKMENIEWFDANELNLENLLNRL